MEWLNVTKADYKYRTDFLYTAIRDSQNTIRLTDAKAVAVIGFWTFFITTLFKTKDIWTKHLLNISVWSEVIFISSLCLSMTLFLVLSIYLAYISLVPKSNPNEHICNDDHESKGLFYLHGYNKQLPLEPKYLLTNQNDLKLQKSTGDYRLELENLDEEGVNQELIIELQKVSFIRNLKIDRISASISYIMKFLTLLGIIIVYLAGKQLISYEGGQSMATLELNVTLFIVLYIGHKIGDYLFQTDKQALHKSKQLLPLITHCSVYTIILISLAFLITGFFSWLAVFILFISHFIIDGTRFLKWWAKHIKKMSDPENAKVKLAMFELDQAFHYVILFIISFLN